jgi:hypothetical protein
MIRSSIVFAIALSFLAPALSYASTRSEQIVTWHYKEACKGKIGAKNLKGAALKTEWHKCMANPGDYN